MNDTRKGGPVLGHLVAGSDARDAVHVAICLPMLARDRLMPGQHVRVEEGEALAAVFGEGVGIVDPFLQASVRPGERFWLVLYPGSITSLRHEWSHPQLPHGDADIAASEQWLRQVAEDSCTEYDKILAGALEGHIVFGSETDGRVWAEQHYAELWHHLGVVLHRRFAPDQFAFSCGC